jgi:hypothetical protein
MISTSTIVETGTGYHGHGSTTHVLAYGAHHAPSVMRSAGSESRSMVPSMVMVLRSLPWNGTRTLMVRGATVVERFIQMFN